MFPGATLGLRTSKVLVLAIAGPQATGIRLKLWQRDGGALSPVVHASIENTAATVESVGEALRVEGDLGRH